MRLLRHQHRPAIVSKVFSGRRCKSATDAPLSPATTAPRCHWAVRPGRRGGGITREPGNAGPSHTCMAVPAREFLAGGYRAREIRPCPLDRRFTPLGRLRRGPFRAIHVVVAPVDHRRHERDHEGRRSAAADRLPDAPHRRDPPLPRRSYQARRGHGLRRRPRGLERRIPGHRHPDEARSAQCRGGNRRCGRISCSLPTGQTRQASSN